MPRAVQKFPVKEPWIKETRKAALTGNKAYMPPLVKYFITVPSFRNIAA
jgi:hypothetical protein